MKYVYYSIDIILVVLIALCLFINNDEKVLVANSISKSLTSTKLTKVGLSLNNIQNITPEENNNEIQVEEEKPIEIIEDANYLEKRVLESTPPASVVSDVLETQVGPLSAYGPDCVGCSGRLAQGFNASGGNYIYHDETYGDVRIMAGDPSYPFGSIFRVKGSKLGEFYAIVLDRGGGIGFGRRFLFDLLFPSESDAASFGTSYNVTFELLRRGA